MFNLRCVINCTSAVCRQLSASLNANGSSRWARGVMQRTLCSSAVRLQEVAASTTDSGTRSRDFRRVHIPPLLDEDSPLRWGGKKFEELPYTHIQVTDCAGGSLVRTSCGTEGFKNIKKSTPVAAQTAAISAAAKATAKGVTYVRVVVKGLGPGRLSAIKGLTMGGLEVVSITDNTPVPHNGCRPRKARRI
uniref:Small ribosomal subunit protein uS11m n=1 Tax=Neogobius melanostomus TaxID=47308 RepID=A0A8C6TH25_9GOBI